MQKGFVSTLGASMVGSDVRGHQHGLYRSHGLNDDEDDEGCDDTDGYDNHEYIVDVWRRVWVRDCDERVNMYASINWLGWTRRRTRRKFPFEYWKR
jgi:hypothetical protein